MKRREIQDLIKKYSKRLHLSEWKINLIISKDEDNGDGGVGECKSDHRYKFATITIYKDAFEHPNDIEHIVKHELCHCLTDPLYKYCYDFLNGRFRTHHDIEDQRELLTEWIAKII